MGGIVSMRQIREQVLFWEQTSLIKCRNSEAENSDDRITYQCSAMEDLEFPAETFDIVISSLAFHYVKEYEQLMKRIVMWLKQGGELVFSVEHPVFTSYGTQDWYYNADGNILHFPVDNYYYEGERNAVFLGEKVTKYHRTMTTYINSLLENGFIFGTFCGTEASKGDDESERNER